MRKLLIGLLASALLLFGAVLPLVLPWHCPVNRAACERIEEGMTQEEVYAILGGPPGNYRTQPPAPPPSFAEVYFGGPRRLTEVWEGDTGAVTVDYHCRRTPGVETVELASFEEQEPYNPGLVELICWRLERLKERWLP
jgi:hypothetical protein